MKLPPRERTVAGPRATESFAVADGALEETRRALASPAALESLAADPYWPKWESPWWRMLLLYEMGRAGDIPRPAVEALVEGLATHYLPTFPLRPEEIPPGKDPQRHVACHCALGCAAQLLAGCGVDVDARLPWIRPWFLRWQLPDGGLNCDEAAYARPVPRSSVVSTLPPLEAVLLRTPRAFTPAEAAFLDRGAEYLVARRLWRSLSRGGAPIDPAWADPCFPRYYFYDLLRGLRFLVRWAQRRQRPLPRAAMEEAAASIAARVDPEGRLAPGRRPWEGARGPRRDAAGTWRDGEPARTFPLLEALSAPGSPSPILTREWAEVRAALEADRAGRPLAIRTGRLVLEPVTAASAAAAADGSAALGRALGARIPESWPPRLPDDDGGVARAGFAFVRERLAGDPRLVGWWGWWVLLPGPERPTLVGTVSPKGAPDAEGTAEIAWGVASEHEGRGFATEAASALVEWLGRDPRVRLVIAETLPELGASLAVMRKLGMRPLGPGAEAGTVRWGRPVSLVPETAPRDPVPSA